LGKPAKIIASMLCAAALNLCSATELGATRFLYRIGGQETPPEVPEGWDVEFVWQPWSDIDEERFGVTELIDLSQEFIAPQGLDPDQNQTPLVRGRGGWIKAIEGFTWRDEPALVTLFDEDPNTAYSGGGGSQSTAYGSCFGTDLCEEDERIFSRFSSERQPSRGIWINLGGLFPIRRIELFPSPTYAARNERVLDHFLIGTNDGDTRKDGRREAAFWDGRPEFFVDYDIRHLRFTNNTPHLVLDMADVPVENIIFEATLGVWELAEFEVYGAGFAPVATYTSNIIDLIDPAALGEMSWSGSNPEGTEIVISARSGDRADPNSYWRLTFRGDERSRLDDEGVPLTRAAYDKLENGAKAGVSPNTEDWDNWLGLEYDTGAADVAGRGARQFIQFQAQLLSDRPVDARSQLDYVEFEIGKPPLVTRALAEISPIEVKPREVTRFQYFILPEFEIGDLGFDSIEIETPVRAASVDSLILSTPDGEDRIAFDVSALATIGDSGFTIQIPEGFRRTLETEGEPIEVIFRSSVYTYGAQFPGRVFDSTKPWEVHQRLTPGDVDLAVDSSRLTVGLTEVGGASVGTLELSTPVLTPNGDGMNDELAITYELVNLAGSVPVSVDIYDLSGRLVAQFLNSRASGKWHETWYGTYGNELNGALAPPGVYIIRMDVDTDESTDTALSSVALAY
jgi:hypothetical protein